MTFGNLTLLGCGDVGPIHEPMEQYTSFIKPVLAQTDVRVAQCGRLYTTRGVREPFGRPQSRFTPRMARIFKDCNFDVVSVAGNHAMDWGGRSPRYDRFAARLRHTDDRRRQEYRRGPS